jgi:phosphoglycolate phosphatase
MPRAIVLFDIDGTLLVTGGASSRCIRRCAQRVLGSSVEAAKITVGTLDPQIFGQLASHCGITPTPEQLEQYKSLYLADLEQELSRVAADIVVMPGVRQVLEQLRQREDVVVGLLTGNFEAASRLKLRAAGLDEALFEIGAFAEDGMQRSELVPAALRKVERSSNGPAEAQRTILIGDTPRDIECARQAGCLVLSVATGHYSLAELQSHHPDAAVADLTDSRPLYDLIGRAGRA